ncbi:MAG TPA: hypothetical protein VNB22_01595 [Pyrinomonadaceae bacterium]|nr:hypothetical protein [Pyrinomonadaceae bacterium]
MVAINQKIRRLPGFRFEAQAPSREDVLPRMDVALFVGFASAGPVGIPVAVESAEQFKTIFGNDLPLVWDTEKGETLYAYLAPTVRSFFRNGGKRCWVLRVARLEPSHEKPLNRACYNLFPLSGLACVSVGADEVKNIRPAFARARAKGSWSDDLQTGTAILSNPAKLLSLTGSDAEKIVTLEIGANEIVSTGDLLRFTFREEELFLLLAVDEILEDEETHSPPTPKKIASFGKQIVRFKSNRFVWLKKLSDQILFEEPYKVDVKMWSGQSGSASDDSQQSFFSERSAVFTLKKPKNKESFETVILTFSNLSSADTPATGSLLMTKLKQQSIGLQVETVSFGNDETQKEVEIICRATSCQRKIKQPASSPQAEFLSFELWIKKDKESFIKLSDLAFNADHERFWGNLPTDEEVYRFAEPGEKKLPAWTRSADAVNFPLAGGGDERESFYFPLFAAAVPENYLGAVSLLGTKLQRDGLEVFDEELFLDRKLKNTGSGNLLNEAEFIRYLSFRPRTLWGIHSALVPETAMSIAAESLPTNPTYTSNSLDECTIISVPDAVHRGWSHTIDEGEILSPPHFSPPLRPEWWHFQDCRKPDVQKVSAPLWGNFLDCGLRIVEAPENLRVREESVSSGKFTIIWKSDESGKDLEFVLEESSTPKFEFPQEIYRGKEKRFEVSERSAGVYFYRVRAEIGKDFSNWSDGLAVKIPAAENWAENSVKDYKSDVLLAVQRALLRMCAARGDLFAVLNLPEHFDEINAFEYVGTLKTTKGFAPQTAGVEPFSADETRALSFGAVYHPWLLTHEDDFEDFRNIPPDGANSGVMARRSYERGAWIAPANEKLQGILGLAKNIRRERFLDFQDNLINLVRPEPSGFLVLDSDTLSDDADWRSINVRRLISLLRRLAVKHGAEYVFEPNNERFRRQVQRGFSAMLDLMFVRGAFAGTTPANSYQVVVSETINNFQSVEQGRFIVELRVAPSLPLKFVTVRLVQAGGRSNVFEVF